jgi:acid phosphatase (class A)
MLRARHWMIVPALLLLSACAGGDKFPFPPQFVDTNDVPPTALAAPPAPDSAIQKKEIAQIIAKQAKLSDAQKEAMMHEDSITPRMIITPILGDSYSEETHPKLYNLMRRAASDAWRIGDNTQEYWMRTRPWLADERVELLVKRITRPSYPSGHTVTNHVWAHVLSDLFPSKRKALFKRAHEIGSNRMLGGVHFPSDIAAGKKLAAIIYKEMRKDQWFQQHLAKVRAEIKSTSAHQKKHSLPSGLVPECITPEPGISMTMCQ